jgi:alpha-galactosidase
MAKPIKLGVIGAGSATFSAGLVQDICLRESLAGSHVTLMDVDEARVGVMGKFARRYAAEMGAAVTFEATTDREACLREADFVINTAQVGGHSSVEALRDWTESWGYYRGFRLDPALNIRLMLAVAQDMERLCPDAWLIQAGNPVFEGCTAMARETGVKVCGLCHGHFGYRELAEGIGLDPDRTTALAVGFNHCIWLLRLECDGEDALPRLEQWVDQEAEEFWRDYDPEYSDNQMARAAVELYQLTGLFPIGDTTRQGGWWFHTDLAAKKKWYGDRLGGFDSELGWAQYLAYLESQVARIERAAEDETVSLTELLPPESTGEQHFPLIEALAHGVEVELQVNVPNNGAVDGIPDDVVVEVPALCSAEGIQPRPIGRLPEQLMVNVLGPRLVAAERLISLAARPDGRTLMAMILDDHRTRSWEQAVEFYQAVLERPEFAELDQAMRAAGRAPDFRH